MTRWIVLFAMWLLASCARARVEQSIDLGWRFAQEDAKGAEAEKFDDSKWQTVDLPHDWSIIGPYNKDAAAGGTGAYRPFGVGWYRRTIEVPAEWVGERIWIEFDAACAHSTVWVNGHELGTRPYGFVSFGYDVTPYVRPGMNTLAVRIDNSKVPTARWYTGSGLYAHVHLVAMDEVHFARHGNAVLMGKVSADAAHIELPTQIDNDSAKDALVTVRWQLIDPDGRDVENFGPDEPFHIEAGAKGPFIYSCDIFNPQLWSPDAPRLYQIVCDVYRDKKVIDERKIYFGVRSVAFDADKGFSINGKPLKLRGMGMHWDCGAMGSAIPDAILKMKLRLLKDMGCNAVRTGHTPFPPKFYELCDEMGLMVVDELFDGWHKKAAHDYGADAFKDWWRKDATEIVMRDRSHPCVILWSIGNETGAEDKHGISKLVHSLDESRLTTGARVVKGDDVAGFNSEGENPGYLEKWHAKNPAMPILLTEEPHVYQTRGFYRTLTWFRQDEGKDQPHYPFPPYSDVEVFPTGGDPQFNSSYDNAVLRMPSRVSWKRTRDTPWICGEFRWVGFDYLGEASYAGRHWPLRYGSPGVIDTALIPKDIYYFYQSQWTDAPMVHLLPHWSHPEVALGTKIPVVAYSNCDEVELFLNGVSLGKQKEREFLDFVWQVPWKPGKIRAIGYRGGKEVAAAEFRTCDQPTKLTLTVDHPNLKADRRDVAVVTVGATDDKGAAVPWAENRVSFKLSGPARFLGCENGNPADVTDHRSGYRDLFAGLARAFYAATDDDGPVELTAVAALGSKRFEKQTTVAIDAERVALRGDLEPAKFDVLYSVDGSAPSIHYDKPFMLDLPATVNVLLMRDGKKFLTSRESFEKGPPVRWTDSRFTNQN